jgi:hypothetical protein
MTATGTATVAVVSGHWRSERVDADVLSRRTCSKLSTHRRSLTGLQTADTRADTDEARIYEALRADEELLQGTNERRPSTDSTRRALHVPGTTVDARMEETRRRLAELQGSAVLVSVPTGEVREAWEVGSLDRRRALADAVLARNRRARRSGSELLRPGPREVRVRA